MSNAALEMLDEAGLALISSVRTGNSYHIPIELTKDTPALMAFLDARDEGVRHRYLHKDKGAECTTQ